MKKDWKKEFDLQNKVQEWCDDASAYEIKQFIQRIREEAYKEGKKDMYESFVAYLRVKEGKADLINQSKQKE